MLEWLLMLNMSLQKVKTSVVKSNLNPEWNEELTISIKDLNVPIFLVRIILPY